MNNKNIQWTNKNQANFIEILVTAKWTQWIYSKGNYCSGFAINALKRVHQTIAQNVRECVRGRGMYTHRKCGWLKLVCVSVLLKFQFTNIKNRIRIKAKQQFKVVAVSHCCVCTHIHDCIGYVWVEHFSVCMKREWSMRVDRWAQHLNLPA